MRLIDADALIEVQMYDEEHEEWSVVTMTVEECLARFADVPTIIETNRPKGKQMTNAEKFKSLFGIYATELWAMPEAEFLKWLNADRPQGKWIKTDVATYRCSECGKIQIADDINELNYCCCGSHNKMR